MFTSCPIYGNKRPGTHFPLAWANIKRKTDSHTHCTSLIYLHFHIQSSKVFIKLNNILSVFNIHSPFIHYQTPSKHTTNESINTHITLSRRNIFKVLNFHQNMGRWRFTHFLISTQVIIVVYHTNIVISSTFMPWYVIL